jgi:hypothetical protein
LGRETDTKEGESIEHHDEDGSEGGDAMNFGKMILKRAAWSESGEKAIAQTTDANRAVKELQRTLVIHQPGGR